MKRRNISYNSPFESQIGFSRAVRIANFISVSGTAPITPNGLTLKLNDVYSQTRYCIEIIKKSIEKAGGKLEDVIRTRIILKDINNWKEAAKAHFEFFKKIKPACTFFEVNGFVNPDWLVEIEADCVLLHE